MRKTKSKIEKAFDSVGDYLTCNHVWVKLSKPLLAGAVSRRCSKCKTTTTIFEASKTVILPKLKKGVNVRANTKRF